MLTRILPEIDNWYENQDTGALFEVVAIDERGTVAMQHFEGEIEEIDREAFVKMRLRKTEQPDDWGGPYEVDTEDRFESDFFSPSEEDDQEPGIEPDYMRLVE